MEEFRCTPAGATFLGIFRLHDQNEEESPQRNKLIKEIFLLNFLIEVCQILKLKGRPTPSH